MLTVETALIALLLGVALRAVRELIRLRKRYEEERCADDDEVWPLEVTAVDEDDKRSN